MFNQSAYCWFGLQLIVAFSLVPAARSLALSPMRAVERPPDIYQQGPTLTGRTMEFRLKAVAEVDRACRAMLGGLPEGGPGREYYWACYIPKLDMVLLVDPQSWPSHREWEAVRAHEWAHARGWRHLPDGRGTDWAASVPPPGPSLAQAADHAGRNAAAVAPDQAPGAAREAFTASIPAVRASPRANR